MKAVFRTIHRKIAPILFLPLLLTALTGIGYRLGKTWLGIPNSLGEQFMKLHEGAFLGQSLVPFYVLATGLGLLGLIVTGLTMLRRLNRLPFYANKRLQWRLWHQWLSPIFFLPLALSAVTGMVYPLGKDWFGMPQDISNIVIKLHQGSYFGHHGRALYVLFLGIGLLALLITGIKLVKLFSSSDHRPSSIAND